MGGGRPTAAAVLGNAADGRRPVPSVSPTPTVCAGGPCVPSSPSQSTPRPGTARPGTPRRGAGKVQRCSGLCAVMQRGASRAEIARVVQQGHCARVAGRWGEGAQVSWLLCAERALNGKMSEASLMSFASTLRRGNFSAHSSSALIEIALKRSFFSGTAAAISMEVSASADTSIEASTSYIHTPVVARAARALDTGVNVDSCSAVASAGSMRSAGTFMPASSMRLTKKMKSGWHWSQNSARSGSQIADANCGYATQHRCLSSGSPTTVEVSSQAENA